MNAINITHDMIFSIIPHFPTVLAYSFIFVAHFFT